MAPALEDVRPKFELQNRNYIVTGGAQGIGFACARAICEMGGNVVIMDIQEQPVKEYKTLSSKFGVKTEYIQTDVTSEESLNSSFAKAIEILGGIDGLIPCAGIAIDKPFTEQTWAEMTRIQEINVGALARKSGLTRLLTFMLRFVEFSFLLSSPRSKCKSKEMEEAWS